MWSVRTAHWKLGTRVHIYEEVMWPDTVTSTTDIRVKKDDPGFGFENILNRPFRWPPWDCISEKIWMVDNGKRQVFDPIWITCMMFVNLTDNLDSQESRSLSLK